MLVVRHTPFKDEGIEADGTFYVYVRSPEQALEVIEILQEYDRFQYNHQVKLEHTAGSGLLIFWEMKWNEWYSDSGHDISEWYPGIEKDGSAY